MDLGLDGEGGFRDNTPDPPSFFRTRNVRATTRTAGHASLGVRPVTRRGQYRRMVLRERFLQAAALPVHDGELFF